VARLFKAIAYAERIHASNHYRNIRSEGDALTTSMAAFGSKTTSEDLQIGIDGETFEIEEMYPAYLDVAKMQKEYAAEVTFRFAWEAEKTHAELFKKAKASIDEERDPDARCAAILWRGSLPINARSAKPRKNDSISTRNSPSLFFTLLTSFLLY